MIHTFDALLVLGCGIDESGELIDDARLSVKIAAKLFKQQVAPLIIFTGNYSYKANFVPRISESQAMKDDAITLGIPAEKIHIETESKDTLGNAYFTKVNLLEPLALRRIAILRGPNQSEERVRYIFDKVLGQQYDYELVDRDENRPEEQKRERKSLVVVRNWLKDVEDGDEGAVYKVMCARHPAYSTEPGTDEALRRELDEA